MSILVCTPRRHGVCKDWMVDISMTMLRAASREIVPIDRQRQWYRNSQRQIIVRFEAQSFREFGSPQYEEGHDPWTENLHYGTLGHPFEIAMHEVTIDQFNRFAIETGGPPVIDATEESKVHPAEVSGIAAFLYCNWLSNKEGLTPFFQFENEIVRPNWVSRRLPIADLAWMGTCQSGRHKGQVVISGKIPNSWTDTRCGTQLPDMRSPLIGKLTSSARECRTISGFSTCWAMLENRHIFLHRIEPLVSPFIFVAAALPVPWTSYVAPRVRLCRCQLSAGFGWRVTRKKKKNRKFHHILRPSAIRIVRGSRRPWRSSQRLSVTSAPPNNQASSSRHFDDFSVFSSIIRGLVRLDI